MKRIAAVAIVVLAACAPLGLTVGCAATIGRAYRADSVDQLLPGKTTEDSIPPRERRRGGEAAPELAPFVELARETECADDRRRLFAIDNVLVFFDRAGGCPDNYYSETLFGGSVDEVLCASHDSIAGPVTECHDAAFRELFETIIAHLDEPDLGLGSGHTVHQVPV